MPTMRSSTSNLDAEIHEEFFGHEHITVIEPHGSLLDFKFKELWGYRDLIVLFVRRDFVAQYKQTILGPAWHVVQPLMTTVIFTLVFGKIAKIPTDGVPPFLFYMAGTVVWNYFAGVLNETSNTFTANAHIFGKVYFPRLVMPVATLLSKMIGFAIQFGFFLLFYAYYLTTDAGLSPNFWILATPLLLLLMAALGLGFGIIVSSATTRYRDLTIVVGFGVQLFMYLSPIVYPLSSLTEPYRRWMTLNPVAPVVETFRHAFLGGGDASFAQLGLSCTTTLAILFIGILLFNRVELTFMDTV
jgi:lipopolysaccharide transport system permease protein